METIVILIMLLVIMSFLLKLTFMRPWQIIMESVLIALAVVLSTEIAVTQSKTLIEEWLQTPELMLDLAVILTIDVALQLAFCILMVSTTAGRKDKIFRGILLFIPGFMIFPVAFFMLVSMIFYFTGINFYAVGCGVGGGLLIILPILAWGLKYLLPERAGRLEMIFYLNCIIGMLGIIATVNGRTATVGVNELNLPALFVITGIIFSGCITGLILFKRNINRNL